MPVANYWQETKEVSYTLTFAILGCYSAPKSRQSPDAAMHGSAHTASSQDWAVSKSDWH